MKRGNRSKGRGSKGSAKSSRGRQSLRDLTAGKRQVIKVKGGIAALGVTPLSP